MKRGRKSTNNLNEFYPKVGYIGDAYTRIDSEPEPDVFDFILEPLVAIDEAEGFIVIALDASYVVSFKEDEVIVERQFWGTNFGSSLFQRNTVNQPFDSGENHDFYALTSHTQMYTYPYQSVISHEDGTGFIPMPLMKVAADNSILSNFTTNTEYAELYKDFWSDFTFKYTGGDYAYTWGYDPYLPFDPEGSPVGVSRLDINTGEITNYILSSPGAPTNRSELDGHTFIVLPDDVCLLWHEYYDDDLQDYTARRFLIDMKTMTDVELDPLPPEASPNNLMSYYGEYFNTAAEGPRFGPDNYMFAAIYNDYKLTKFDSETHELLWTFNYEDALTEFVGPDGSYTDQEWAWQPLVYNGELYFYSWITTGIDPDTWEYEHAGFRLFKVDGDTGELVPLGYLELGEFDFIHQTFALGRYYTLLVEYADESLGILSIDVTTGAVALDEKVPGEITAGSIGFDSYPHFSVYHARDKKGAVFMTFANTDALVRANLDFTTGEASFVEYEGWDFLAAEMRDEQHQGASIRPDGTIVVSEGVILYSSAPKETPGLRRLAKPTVGYNDTDDLALGFHNPWTDDKFRPPIHLGLSGNFYRITVNGVFGNYFITQTRNGNDITFEFFEHDGIDWNTKVHEITANAPTNTYGGLRWASGNHIYLQYHNSEHVRGRVDVDTGTVTFLPAPVPQTLPPFRRAQGIGEVGGSTVWIGTSTTQFTNGTTACFRNNGSTWASIASLPAHTGSTHYLNVNGVIYFHSDSMIVYLDNLGSTWQSIPLPTEEGYTITMGLVRMMDDSEGNIHFVNMFRTDNETNEQDYVTYILDATTKTWTAGEVMPKDLQLSDYYGNNFAPFFIKYKNIGFLNSGRIDTYYVLP